DPVDHVAAVRGAERAGVVAVEKGILLERRREAELEIHERLAAPVAVDRIRELLAVAGGAVKVDRDDAVTLRRIGLRVPAIAPAFAEAALRPAVDQERDRVALPLLH